MNGQSDIEMEDGGPAIAGVPTADQSDGVERHIFVARIRLLFTGAGLPVAASFINAAILAVIHRNVTDTVLLGGWVVFIAASLLWRQWLSTKFSTLDPGDEDIDGWARKYFYATLWTGLAWGAAGVLMLPEASPPHQVVTAFVVGGTAAAAVTTLTRYYPAFLAFVILALVPIALHFAWIGGEVGYGMAAMYALFLLFLLNAGRKQSEALEESLRLSMENRDLVDHLTEEKARAEQLNAELRREIAERERVALDLRDREASLATAQHIAGLGSWEWNAATNEVRYSDEGYVIFGLDKDSPSNYQDAMDRIPEDDRKRIEAKIGHAFQTGEPYSVEHRLMHPVLGERTILERAQVVRDENGGITGLVGTAHDTTEHNRIMRDLEDARQQAEDASRAKSIFLANMSHEFRTPLNAIIGYSEIMKEDAIAADRGDAVVDLDRINAAGRHLLALVNEVLDLSKIEAGRMELRVENFDVAQIVEDLVGTVRPLAAGNRNEIQVDCEAGLGEMTADATKVRQVLYNLVSNAAKFTEQGRIDVKARRLVDSAEEGSGDWILFTVADTGIGMDPDRIETAFMAFDQLDPSATRRYGGTGLGLAISRRYCEMMGGAISAESEPGIGSVFSVRLPARVPAGEV